LARSIFFSVFGPSSLFSQSICFWKPSSAEISLVVFFDSDFDSAPSVDFDLGADQPDDGHSSARPRAQDKRTGERIASPLGMGGKLSREIIAVKYLDRNHLRHGRPTAPSI